MVKQMAQRKTKGEERKKGGLDASESREKEGDETHYTFTPSESSEAV